MTGQSVKEIADHPHLLQPRIRRRAIDIDKDTNNDSVRRPKELSSLQPSKGLPLGLSGLINNYETDTFPAQSRYEFKNSSTWSTANTGDKTFLE
ncbi:hypothetical protein GTR04_4380 [Trichophyton interdigitale]|uniref:Uncharacterized protein n=2 Tax=Trichophyton interdigitale TaxID=101480 RepID=A0A9P4YHY5_9EURO|nr:hypothetical protein GY631_4241 [Trichophyton interdigitale]KAF3893911.1 hypothetical protein GY632_3996 [Trichophyton interdigitale]KAG8208236.1 hypothetical protein GTR04_4380 [Trichophyton interdigitale]KDB25330.1 hypothetical protein H109_02833 [Trichophyton interdigitale MR816]